MQNKILKVILNRIVAAVQPPGDETPSEQQDVIRTVPDGGIQSIIRDVTNVPTQGGQPCCEIGCCRIIYASMKTVSYADVEDQITPISGVMAAGMPPNIPFRPETLTISQYKTACVSTTKEGCAELKALWNSGGLRVAGFVSGRACFLKQLIENIKWNNKSCESLNCGGAYGPVSLFAFNPFNGAGGQVELPMTYNDTYHHNEQAYKTFVNQAITSVINKCVPLTASQATELGEAIEMENALEDAVYITATSAFMFLISGALMYRTVTGTCTAAAATPTAAAMTKKQIAMQALRITGTVTSEAGLVIEELYEPELIRLDFMSRMPNQWPIYEADNLGKIPFCYIPPNTLDEESGLILSNPNQMTPITDQVIQDRE